MDGLKKSERGRSDSQTSSINKTSQSPPMGAAQEPFFNSFQRSETADSKSFGRSSGSSLDKTDTIMFGSTPPRTTTTTFDIPPSERQNTGLRNLDNPSYASLSRFFPGIGRQGTSMTTSTNFSIGSTKDAYYGLKDKLHGYTKSDVKDIFRLLKRFTISNEVDSQSAFSPRSATGGFPIPITNFRGQTQGVMDTGVARYFLPGNFVGSTSSTYESLVGHDQFGNTFYHLLAASGEDIDSLIGLVSQESIAVLNATNTGGQTFLHVLHSNWFEEGSRLSQLVNQLRARQFNFFAADAYGQTFFHLLRLKMKSNQMRDITQHFHPTQLNRRDAFGAKPMLGRASTIPANREPSLLTIPGSNDRSQQKISEQGKLLSIITGANDPARGNAQEDNQGRNALHCLAEVVLGMAAIEAHANGTPTKGVKRKMDVKDEPVLQNCPLSRRLQYLETVLQANVDVNHYNTSGDTVLMAFVTHVLDGQEDKDLEQIIKKLIAAGANLEARNRNGETALQVAARSGQKFAVRVLLEQGANFHVRNCDGRSVLQTIDDYTRLYGEYPEQHARLEATRGVFSGRFSKCQAVQEPSLLQEWSIRSPLSPKSA